MKVLKAVLGVLLVKYEIKIAVIDVNEPKYRSELTVE